MAKKKMTAKQKAALAKARKAAALKRKKMRALSEALGSPKRRRTSPVKKTGVPTARQLTAMKRLAAGKEVAAIMIAGLKQKGFVKKSGSGWALSAKGEKLLGTIGYTEPTTAKRRKPAKKKAAKKKAAKKKASSKKRASSKKKTNRKKAAKKTAKRRSTKTTAKQRIRAAGGEKKATNKSLREAAATAVKGSGKRRVARAAAKRTRIMVKDVPGVRIGSDVEMVVLI